MDFIDIADLRPQVAHLLPGLLDPRIDALFLEVARDFSARTLFSQEAVGPYGLTATINDVALESPDPSQVEVIQVVSGTVQGYPLHAAVAGQLDATSPSWRTAEAARPTHFVAIDRLTIQLVPRPTVTVADALWLIVACQPVPDATAIDRRIAGEFQQALIDGVLARAYGQASKIYSNPNLAFNHRSEYEHAVSHAKARANRGYHAGSVRADPRRFV